MDVTSAELTAEQKNAISHRGKAFRALGRLIAEQLG
jgi:XTP/dITP diphosphohydrolase